MNYKSEKDLQDVNVLCNEAEIGLIDRSRTISQSSIPKRLAKTLTLAGGAYIGASAAMMLVPGVVPVMLVGAIGAGIASHFNKQKLKDQKLLCYKQAIAKQNAIIKALKQESSADKERIEYLTALNIELTEVIKKLQSDLDI